MPLTDEEKRRERNAAVSAKQADRRARGLCIYCDKPLATKWHCREHADRASRNSRETMRRRLARGLCSKCSKPRVTKWHCREHADAATERFRERIRSRMELGLCIKCDKPRVSKWYCAEHVTRRRETGRRRDAARKGKKRSKKGKKTLAPADEIR